MKINNLYAAALLIAGPAFAGDAASTSFVFDGSFEDATFGVESAIIDRGLVVEFVSRVGKMLERTGADVGSDIKIFDNAEVFLFCSAVLSRKVMEADPMNVAHCPYSVFVTEIDDKVSVGYRNLPEGPMQDVQALLDAIAREAVDQ